jgi:hypothetical protein
MALIITGLVERTVRMRARSEVSCPDFRDIRTFTSVHRRSSAFIGGSKIFWTAQSAEGSWARL